MFVPKYTITNSILKNIGIIDAARAVIMMLPLNSGWESKLRRQAQEAVIAGGLKLSGNSLSEGTIKEVLDGQEVFGPGEDIKEVLDYQNALSFIIDIVEEIKPPRPYLLTIETLKEIHKLSGASGEFRQKQVVIKSSETGKITYSPPPAAEVPYLMEDLLNWVNTLSYDLHPVIKSAILHFELARIHPFTEKNDLIARITSMLVLYLDGYEIRRLLSLEEEWAQDILKYNLVMMAVLGQHVLDVHERDLTEWISFFVEGFSSQVLKAEELVLKVSLKGHVKGTLGEEVELNERQMAIIDYLQRHKEMRNRDFRKIFPDFSDDTVLRELKFLKQKGLVKKTGGTKKAVYVLN